MRILKMLALATLFLPLCALAQNANEWRYRTLLKDTPVHLVLRTGGECDGKVAERQQDAVRINLTKHREACVQGESEMLLPLDKIISVDEGYGARREASGMAGAWATSSIGMGAAGALAAAGHAGISSGVAAAIPLVGLIVRSHHSSAGKIVLYVARLD